MCGEKYLKYFLITISLGSPPHVRGKEYRDQPAGMGLGITPACAGKRRFQQSWRLRRGDHPRMCGEKCDGMQEIAGLSGSPPHVRGKATDIYTIANALGITPACAGKRSDALLSRSVRRDHPRMCGEKLFLMNLFLKELGSPPHVRGKEKGSPDYAFAKRITPACAGKSADHRSKAGHYEDHPRMCGEKRTAFCVGFCV